MYTNIKYLAFLKNVNVEARAKKAFDRFQGKPENQPIIEHQIQNLKSRRKPNEKPAANNQ
jgi:hypothetical protein